MTSRRSKDSRSPFRSPLEGEDGQRPVENYEGEQTIEVLPTDFPKMKVYLFGGLRVYIDGQKVPDSKWSQRKAKLLFAHLVTRFGREVGRNKLIESLWPDMDAIRAVDNFYVIWSAVKRALKNKNGDCPYVISNGSLYRIDPILVESDVQEFDYLARYILFHKISEKEMSDIFVRMDQIYSGDMLTGTECDAYMERVRERYRHTYIDALLAASEIMLESGNNGGALWFSRKAFSLETQREDVYQILMKSQGMSGQRTAAMETFFLCKRYLDEQLGATLSKKTIELYEKILNDEL